MAGRQDDRPAIMNMAKTTADNMPAVLKLVGAVATSCSSAGALSGNARLITIRYFVSSCALACLRVRSLAHGHELS